MSVTTAFRRKTSPRPFDRVYPEQGRRAQDKPRAFRPTAPVVVGEAGRQGGAD